MMSWNEVCLISSSHCQDHGRPCIFTYLTEQKKQAGDRFLASREAGRINELVHYVTGYCSMINITCMYLPCKAFQCTSRS